MAQPGWYPDGRGNNRYWDGSRWGDAQQTAAQPAVPPVSETPYQPPPAYPSRPTRDRSSVRMPLWQPILFGVLILLGGIGVGVAAGKGSAKTVAGPTTTATATVQSTVTATPTVLKTIATKTQIVTQTYTPPPVNQFTDGTFRIGPDIPAGVYKTDGAGGGSIGCYYAVLNSLNTTDIANNDNFTGPTSVQVPADKAAFETTGGCSWSRVG